MIPQRGPRRHHPYCTCPRCEDAHRMALVAYGVSALVVVAVIVGWIVAVYLG